MKKILIIDDSAFMRSILKDLLLKNEGEITLVEPVEVFEADGKKNALKQIKAIQPDIILLDIVMGESEIEGIEFAEEAKNTFDINKIIVISSIGQTATHEKCTEVGIKEYLQKPFEAEQVITAVNKLLK